MTQGETMTLKQGSQTHQCTYTGNIYVGREPNSVMGPTVPYDTVEFFKEAGGPVVPPLRSSFIEDTERCPRFTLYRNRLGIQTTGYAGALSTGKLLHHGMKLRYQGRSLEEQVAAVRRASEACAMELTRAADAAGFLPNGGDLGGTLADMNEDTDKVVAILSLPYWDDLLNWDDYEIVVLPDGTPMIELLIEVKAQGFSTPIVVQPDLVVRHKNTGEIYIVDYKTCSIRTKLRAEAARLSVQMLLYRFGVQTFLDGVLPGSKVVGAFHILIRKPTIKYCPNTKDKGGFQSYVKRVQEWYAEADAAGENPLLRTRDLFSGPLMPVELYVRLRAAHKAATAKADPNTFYKAGGQACLKYNSVCPYMRLCNTDPVNWPATVTQFYQIRFTRDEIEEES